MNAVMNHSPWEVNAFSKPAGKMGVADYTRGMHRYDPTSSSVEGGIFAGCAAPLANPNAASAQQRARAGATGGGYGKADFLDRLAAAEERDGAASFYQSHAAGMRPEKPTKQEAMQALTKRQTTMRAAEERVRENQQEEMQQRVMNAARRQYACTPQEVAIDQHESQIEQIEMQRRRQHQLQDRDERMQMQISQHQMEQQEQAAARQQRQRQIEARKRQAQAEQQKQQQRQQYIAEREQASKQYFSSDAWQSRHGGMINLEGNAPPSRGNPMQAHARVASPRPQARGGSPRPQGRAASPRPNHHMMPSGMPRGASPRRGPSPRRGSEHTSTLVLAPPGGHSSISFG